MIREKPANSRRLLKYVIAFMIAGHLFAFTSYAQTGNISGTITDSSHQVLVGAQIQVEGRPLATSDDSGKYTLLGVPAGNTKVTVSYLGFASSSQEISVTASATSTLDFTLGVTGVDTELTVSDTPDVVGQQR